MKTLEQELGDSLGLYIQAQSEYQMAGEDYANGKYSFEVNRAEYIVGAEDLGKNQMEREAKIAEHLKTLALALKDLENLKAKKYSQLKIAEKRFEHWKLIARLRIAGGSDETDF